MLSRKHAKGFTIIELLTVIAIMGMLAAIIFAAVTQLRISARDARRISDFKQIQNALAFYNLDNNKYPIYWSAGTTATDPDIAQVRSSGSGSSWLPELAPYSPGGKIPKDPINNNSSDCWGGAAQGTCRALFDLGQSCEPPGANPQEICQNEPLQICKGNTVYYYQSDSKGTNYILYTFLENRKNPSVNWCTGDKVGGSICHKIQGGHGANYIVHGPDKIFIESNAYVAGELYPNPNPNDASLNGKLPCDP